MTTIFETLKGFSMNEEEFFFELGMLFQEVQIEMEIAEHFGETPSFAKEISRLLSR